MQYICKKNGVWIYEYIKHYNTNMKLKLILARGFQFDSISLFHDNIFTGQTLTYDTNPGLFLIGRPPAVIAAHILLSLNR